MEHKKRIVFVIAIISCFVSAACAMPTLEVGDQLRLSSEGMSPSFNDIPAQGLDVSYYDGDLGSANPGNAGMYPVDVWNYKPVGGVWESPNSYPPALYTFDSFCLEVILAYPDRRGHLSVVYDVRELKNSQSATFAPLGVSDDPDNPSVVPMGELAAFKISKLLDLHWDPSIPLSAEEAGVIQLVIWKIVHGDRIIVDENIPGIAEPSWYILYKDYYDDVKNLTLAQVDQDLLDDYVALDNGEFQNLIHRITRDTEIPTPSVLALTAVGLGSFGWLRKRRYL